MELTIKVLMILGGCMVVTLGLFLLGVPPYVVLKCISAFLFIYAGVLLAIKGLIR